MSAEANIKIVRRFVDELWDRGDLAVADQIIAPAGTDTGRTDGLIAGGPETVKRFVADVRRSFSPFHRTIHNIVANDTHVALHSTLTGIHTEASDQFPYPVSDEEIVVTGVATFRIENGLIAEEPWSSWHMAAIGEALAAGAVRRYVTEIWNGGQTGLLPEFVLEGYIRHEPGGDVSGVDELCDAILTIRSAFPDLWFEPTIHSANDGGATVTRRWTMSGTHHGEYRGIAPTGRRVKSSGIGVSRFENGKIAEEWIARDDAGLLAAIS
jgi:predicted ester cyclase